MTVFLNTILPLSQIAPPGGRGGRLKVKPQFTREPECANELQRADDMAAAVYNGKTRFDSCCAGILY
ncbi:MAG: hypothetical protein JRJ12_13725 [Deltaproteobacteria bacterium]|nr:hypothetical protein [Deltaproteobacteria bacterium]